MITNKLEKYLNEYSEKERSFLGPKGKKLGGVSDQGVIGTVNGMLNQIQEIITGIEDQLEEVSEQRFAQEAIEHLNRMYSELVKTRQSLRGQKVKWLNK